MKNIQPKIRHCRRYDNVRIKVSQIDPNGEIMKVRKFRAIYLVPILFLFGSALHAADTKHKKTISDVIQNGDFALENIPVFIASEHELVLKNKGIEIVDNFVEAHPYEVNWKRIRTIDLSNNKIVEANLDLLLRILPKLRYIKLDHNSITHICDNDIKALRKRAGISIYLSYNKIPWRDRQILRKAENDANLLWKNTFRICTINLDYQNSKSTED